MISHYTNLFVKMVIGKNFDMILINTEACENRLMALKREREYIEELNATLNKARPFRTDEELKEYKKEYLENN